MFLYESNNLDMQIECIYSYIKNDVKIYNLKKINLLGILKEVCSTLEDETDFENPTELLSFLDELKLSLDKVRYNIEKLNELSNLLDELKSCAINIKIENFNNLFQKYKQQIFDNDIFIEKFHNKYINYCIFPKQSKESNILLKQKEQQQDVELKQESQEQSNIGQKQEQQPKKEIKQEKQEEKQLNVELKDNNTLLISETKEKVFLPYKIEDLNKILENSKQYQSIEEIINDKYILPISRFKNPVFARLKEAFYLMKYKEKASLSDCLSLALELSVNSYLNPAIITACKNIDELDIYLDYLTDNKTEQFDIFKIEYEMLPAKK